MSSTEASSFTDSFPRELKREKLRVAIVTENFLPKVDGVTRTLARLLEHLDNQGHEAMVLGPETGITQYAGHPVIGTFGVPLLIYPGLKLNFIRPRFIRRLQHFKPDLIHFVDPIWLGAQMLVVVQKWMPQVPCVSSYHTNLPTYATLFGMPWLEQTMWRLVRSLHDRCEIVFCPSQSTRRMLQEKGFKNVEIWGRGVNTELFRPQARDDNLRESWGCTPKPTPLTHPLSPSVSAVTNGVSQLTSDEAILAHLAGKLGVTIVPSRNPTVRSIVLPTFTNSRRSWLLENESVITTPPVGPTGSPPQLSPPPSYNSLHGIPELALGGEFSLPSPAMIPPDSPHIPTPMIESESKDSKTVLLYVGRISWEKNLRFLIEAFQLLPTNVRAKTKLVFVGDGPARAELTRLCNQLDLDVTFMGHQKGKRLAAIYASSSLFAFPSFTETFGQVVLEALASGLPVVGLHAEGITNLVSHGKTGLLFDINAVTKQSTNNHTFRYANVSTSFVDAINEISTKCPSLSYRSRKEEYNVHNGLPSFTPSIMDFATAMTSNTPWFHHCAKAYSMLLERLILDRHTRTIMGQRAVVYASTMSWWDAMNVPITGYLKLINQHRYNQQPRVFSHKKSPLTGQFIQFLVVLYLVGFVFFSIPFVSLPLLVFDKISFSNFS